MKEETKRFLLLMVFRIPVITGVVMVLLFFLIRKTNGTSHYWLLVTGAGLLLLARLWLLFDTPEKRKVNK